MAKKSIQHSRDALTDYERAVALDIYEQLQPFTIARAKVINAEVWRLVKEAGEYMETVTTIEKVSNDDKPRRTDSRNEFDGGTTPAAD